VSIHILSLVARETIWRGKKPSKVHAKWQQIPGMPIQVTFGMYQMNGCK
jgi:hypothetical protein